MFNKRENYTYDIYDIATLIKIIYHVFSIIASYSKESIKTSFDPCSNIAVSTVTNTPKIRTF